MPTREHLHNIYWTDNYPRAISFTSMSIGTTPIERKDGNHIQNESASFLAAKATGIVFSVALPNVNLPLEMDHSND